MKIDQGENAPLEKFLILFTDIAALTKMLQ